MIHQLFENAIHLHQAGQLHQAESLYRQILTQEPTHAGALHYLGLIALQSGQPDTAVELITRSTSLAPDSPEAHSNLGNALKAHGRTADAIAAFRIALQLKPDFPEASYNLGTALLDLREFDQAAAAFRHAIQLKFNYPEAHNNLGTALKELAQLDPAIGAYKQAIALRPNYARALNNLGIALRLKGQLAEAIAACQQAIHLAPTFAEARNNLGTALKENRQPDDAIIAFQQAITLKPDFAEAHLNLAHVLIDTGRLDDAIAALRHAIALNHHLPEAHNNLGTLLRDKGLTEEALAHYTIAAELNPADPIAHFNRGTTLSHAERYPEAAAAFRIALAITPDAADIHEALGATQLLMSDITGAEASFRAAVSLEPASARLWNALGMALNCLGHFEQATDAFRHALKISPDARFYRGLASTGRHVAGTIEIEVLTRLVTDAKLPLDDRITAEFVLAKLLDEESRFDEAFLHFQNANRLFKESRAALSRRFDAGALRRSVDQQIATFAPDFFAARRSWGNPSDLPVFIVGMPRSGTSLVEQIAATHPALFGAGELQTIEHLPITSTPPATWTAPAIASAASAYLNHVRTLAPASALRITDKMPNNIFHLGLLAVMFPNARVIFCRREARDNCLSCFFQQFDNILFSYDLADCARQFNQTHRLAAHWLKTLPLQMLEIQYEALVAGQETESRRLIDFLNLPWNPACLNFHRTLRPVMTASFWQVRQPIYTHSVGRWRHYESHLAPLLQTLEP